MKRQSVNSSLSKAPPLTTELLVLPDGQILVHNLTPAFAELLQQFDPEDAHIASRALRHASCITDHASPLPPPAS